MVNLFPNLIIFTLFVQVAKLEEELSSKTRAFSMLEEKLKMQLDYDEVKRELR